MVGQDGSVSDDDGGGDDGSGVVRFDRFGTILGSTLTVMPGGRAVPFEARSLPPEVRDAPYATFEFRRELPPGWTIRSTTVPASFGGAGGAVEVQVVDGLGRWVPIPDLLQLGII
jgi:hypothetical protein